MITFAPVILFVLMSHTTDEAAVLTEMMTSLLRKMHHLSPTAARILSLLVVEGCHKGITFDELVGHLGASKSSVSASLNHLLKQELIYFDTKENKRRKYFKSFPFDKRFAGFLSLIREEKDFSLRFAEYIQKKPTQEEEYTKKKLAKISLLVDFLTQMEQLTGNFLKKLDEQDSEKL